MTDEPRWVVEIVYMDEWPEGVDVWREAWHVSAPDHVTAVARVAARNGRRNPAAEIREAQVYTEEAWENLHA